MAHVGATDPISALLQTDATTLVHLRALTSSAGAPAHLAAPVLHAAIAWLEGPAQAQWHILEGQVFPALVESMAGSDAICLRDLTTGLTHERDQLDSRWRATIGPLLKAGVPATPELPAWTAAFERHLQRTDNELLPMVPRLFDDDALDSLSRACGDLPGTASPR
ncbi:MAG: hemerythrin domain-containing protein [Castellaniella sp.]|uniref:hemerythrin domain-containing protein n=1 Tax=Castellaniella sp. TaxID=1955812 RepID=UPI0011FF2768|nr:hemerythrin domain-containing protein [Castellaniella sp.]TAN27824.1 MAG: hemerythrin domain-containing protein [Castellaniella sp.]